MTVRRGAPARDQTVGEDGRRPVVVHLFPSMRIGGMERQALNIVRSLRQHGLFDVHAAGLGGPGPVLDELRDAGVVTVPLYPLRGMARASTAGHVLAFARHLRAVGADILHTHDFYTNTFGLAAAAVARVPVRVASRRELDVFTPMQRRVEHAACRTADVIAANCAFLRERLIREGVPAARAVVIPNAVTVPGEPAASAYRQGAGIRSSQGISANAPLVVMVANLHNVKKDFLTAVRAVDMLRASCDGAVLALVGAGTPSPEVRDAVERGTVLLVGLQADVRPWLQAADVCVLSSRSEGLSTAVLEYMAAGRPVVATAVGGMAELIDDGCTGLIVPPGDDAALAVAMGRLLEDRAAAEAMGRAAQEEVRRRHSTEAQLAATLSLYSRLLSDRGVYRALRVAPPPP
ncbi:MAG TPA: glycosyltransferase [Longimicrobiales bacterium]|nr:glycosyltransferase [Longimicrobiales bacterium]